MVFYGKRVANPIEFATLPIPQHSRLLLDINLI